MNRFFVNIARTQIENQWEAQTEHGAAGLSAVDNVQGCCCADMLAKANRMSQHEGPAPCELPEGNGY